MQVGVIGSGLVAKTLATGFLKHGYAVTLGSRSPQKLAEWAAANPKGRTGTFADAAAFGEVIVLAVNGKVAADALRLAGAGNLKGKPVIDATNPIADAPPVNGVVQFFTGVNQSLMEQLQKEFADARLVKAFNSVGAAHMVDPEFPGGKPTMFVCGADAGAKNTAAAILEKFGWEVADMGGAEAAGAIEALCVLWCIPGFRQNQWNHAFKLLRK
ncbi:MAG TPA: NAD(P)-binding domain-containing protein [Terracidiphilus sp.]|nr:NAD(P)-binding domain-containing protein [Terracidiphilus sp.]